MKKQIYGDFKFHGIGQGLFYTGTIHNSNNIFNFVYDCGTFYKRDDELLGGKIRSCFKNKNRVINAVFISHFHKDHISGLPQLFKNYSVENIFIPHFSPKELLLISVENDMYSDPNFQQLFIEPARYFAELGAKNVYQISPTIENSDSFFKSDNENYYQEIDREFPNKTIKVSGDFKQVDSINGARIFKGRNISVNDTDCNWIFKIYQDQTEKEQDNVRNEIINLCKSNFKHYDIEIEDLISNPSLTKDVKNIYDKVKHKINQSSLVLYHSPLTCDENFVLKKYSNHCRCCYFDCHYKYDSPATLLTGDINLNFLIDNGDRFENFLKGCKKHIGFFQIPHHGSYKNTSLNLISKLFPNYMEKICSYGIHNQFRHPDPYMLDNLMQNSCGKIYHVTQRTDFTYHLRIE